ncbi:MAG: 50S ribosomal protein L23 [Candidatus Saccharibacteria bacterium]|nr:50S ribosomal protein L23 [Candidatus Saccharibacteria bacterium]
MSILTIIPIASEKAYATSLSNIYAFKVPMRANKQQIIAAVEAQYGVSVKDVRTLIQNGKTITVSRGKKARPTTTKRVDVKKAYVSLNEGSSIKLFDEAKAEDEKETK